MKAIKERRSAENEHTVVWWPGIGNAINALVDACVFCQKHSPSYRHEPLKQTPLPSRPWEVGTDLFELDK